VADVLTQIEQTESTFAFRSLTPHQPALDWLVYPTNGKVITTKRTGHRSAEKTGHWEGQKLILESSGQGNAPWRRSVTREVISLSADGKTMTMAFHNVGAPEHDYAIDFKRANN
jgi:hypothetical protein